VPRIPHDELFRHTFAQPRHAAALFRLVLPPEIVAAIDWSTLEACDGTFVSGRLRKRHTDLLFRARLGDRTVHLHLILEHKSRSGRGTVLQLNSYANRVQMHNWRQQRGRRRRRLPPVLPVVIHHGKQPWRAPTDLAALLDLRGVPDDLHDALRSYQPRFRYAVFSTAGWSAAQLQTLTLTVLGKATLGALQLLPGVLPERAIPAIVEWVQVFAEVFRAEPGSDSLDALLSYLMRATPLEPERLLDVVWQNVDKEIQMKFKSTAAQLHEQGFAEGRAEGEARGEARGEAKGLVAILGDLLTTRFGTIPDAVATRIRTAQPTQLRTWARRCLDAPTIDAVFADCS
jgi:predicted transposase YdaD